MSTQTGSFGDLGFGLERSTVNGKLQLAGEGLAGANEVLISEVVLTASAADIVFSNIPDDYTHLRIETVARGDVAATGSSYRIQLNGDTTNTNYHIQSVAGFDGSSSFGESSSNNGGGLTGSTATASFYSQSKLSIPDYANASVGKLVICEVGHYYTTDAGNISFNLVSWDTIAAVTSVRLVPSSGNFVSGTVARLIGIKAGTQAQVGGMVKIGEVVLSGSQATIDFANIPQKYDDLRLVLEGRCDTASTAQPVRVELNGDTTVTNYHFQQLTGYNGGNFFAEFANNNFGELSDSTSPANSFGRNEFEIGNYTGAKLKQISTQTAVYTETNGIANSKFVGVWKASTAPVTAITLRPNSGNFVSDTKAILYGVGGAASIGSLPTGYLEGLVPTYTSVSALSIATGSARDGTDSVDLTVSAALSVAITTSGANGLDTGVEAASTVYYLWLIGTGAGTVAGLLSLSNTSPTMPSGYTYKRLLSYIWLNDNNSDQTPFVVDDDGFTTYTNNGASALRTAPMPSPAAGDRLRVLIVDGDGLTLDAQAGDTVRLSTEVSASGGTVSSTQIGASINFLAVDANTWVATSGLGLWTVT